MTEPSPADGGPRTGRDDHAASARAQTQSIESDAEPAAVLALIADPRHLPTWAPAFADAVVQDPDAGWQATKDGRSFLLHVAVSQDAGTVDYLREVAPGRQGGAYLRAVPRPGDGSVITMTVPLPPEVDPGSTAATLRDELAALQRLLAQNH